MTKKTHKTQSYVLSLLNINWLKKKGIADKRSASNFLDNLLDKIRQEEKNG